MYLKLYEMLAKTSINLVPLRLVKVYTVVVYSEIKSKQL